MNSVNTDNLRKWARFAVQMQRVKALFPEFGADLAACVQAVGRQLQLTNDAAETADFDEIKRQAASLRMCAVCGFPLAAGHVRFCSNNCRHVFDRQTTSRRGKRKYILFNVKGKRLLLHRLIWEKNNGRKLRKGEIVHHINCDPCDNRPQNLQAMTAADHTRLHHRINRENRRRLNGNLFETGD